jgi:hypothetical protein
MHYVALLSAKIIVLIKIQYKCAFNSTIKQILNRNFFEMIEKCILLRFLQIHNDPSADQDSCPPTHWP